MTNHNNICYLDSKLNLESSDIWLKPAISVCLAIVYRAMFVIIHQEQS